MYKKSEAIAIAGKTKPTNGTKTDGKKDAAIIFCIKFVLKKK